MKALKFLAIAVVLLAATSATAASWKIDTTHSAVTFKIRHFFSKSVGTFDDWSGTIHFDPENPKDAHVEVVIQTASINTKNEERDGHLRSGDFFDAENHPKITFKSKKVREGRGGWEIVGDLTMRGETREVIVPFEFLGSGPDAWGGTRAGFEAETSLNRKDFGITWNKALDAGGVVLGEEVEIELDIEAMLAQEG